MADDALQSLPQQSSAPTTYPKEIEYYLESLIEDAGLGDLDTDMKAETKQQIFERLDVFLASTIAEHIPDEHIDEFMELNKNVENAQQAQEFMLKYLPDSQKILQQAFIDFRNIYLGKSS